MQVADGCLNDYINALDTSDGGKQAKRNKGNVNCGGKFHSNKDSSLKASMSSATSRKTIQCFLCRGLHRVSNFPHKQTLNTLQAVPSQHEASKDKGKGEPSIGTLQLLYALKGHVLDKKAPPRGLMFVELKINKATHTMINIGAAYNFFSPS